MKGNWIHGKCYSPEYKVWDAMKQRCINSNHKQWEDYGGRGIFVCDEWLTSFTAFLRDMGERPTQGYELDRVNNDDGYYKENCRWVPKSVNQSNKRNRKDCVRVTINNKEYSLRELSKEYGVNYSSLRTRFYRGMRGSDLLKTLPSNSTDTH